MHRSKGGGGTRGPGPPPEKSQKIKFLRNPGPDPLKNHKATKQAFNVGPSSARQRNANNGHQRNFFCVLATPLTVKRIVSQEPYHILGGIILQHPVHAVTH